MNDYMPIDGRPLGVAMGTRPLDLNEWIEIDDQRVAVLEEKDRLLATRRDEVLAHLPAGRPGAEETLDLLIEHLPIRFPDVYGARPDGLTDRQRGIVVRRDAGHPIVVAGRLVQEDLCIMTRTDDGRWVLSAASLCFPSRWRLADKIGRDLGDIHGPVPYYAETIGNPVDRFFERITPDNPVWRTNWHLLDDAALFQPQASRTWRDRMDLDGRDVGDALHFRVERQTLRALPSSGAVLFTIRTYVRPMRDLETLRPGAFSELADTLEATPRATAAYKGWTPLLDETVAWLRERSTTSAIEEPTG
ncbi:MAG: DUF3445 domain-containing protein [Actinobacteria bacterium]|nr:DUF3445 domain-containing protein [Actinomycetota bacterium]